MPTPTYDLIASNVLGSGVTSVSYASIPQTYRDIIIVFNYPDTYDGGKITLNNDTGNTNYTSIFMRGSGSSSTSSTNTGVDYFLQTFTGSGAGNHIVQIMDYSATDKHKTGLARQNYASGRVEATAARWANTAAITEIDIISNGANQFPNGTTIYFYGIVS